MKLQLKRCRTCGAVGVGPAAVRLFPLDGLLYCREHYGGSLDWTVNRSAVVMGLERETKLTLLDAQKLLKKFQTAHPYAPIKNWNAYLHELSGMAAEALVMDDRRTFVYYCARALWAWELSREET